MSVRMRWVLGVATALSFSTASAEERLPDWFANSAIPSNWRWTLDADAIEGIAPYRLTPDIAFDDANLLIRYREVRSLSLYTFASFRHSRLFFGVNEKGYLGLHYRGDETVEFSDLLAGR